jgi:hypothetical protein
MCVRSAVASWWRTKRLAHTSTNGSCRPWSQAGSLDEDDAWLGGGRTTEPVTPILTIERAGKGRSSR